MLYIGRIKGLTPIIHHSAAGVDPNHPANIESREITGKKGRNQTASDLARRGELDTYAALYLDSSDRPTIPASNIRSCIETAARKLKQGPQVREGLAIVRTRFEYDEARYGTELVDLLKTTQFQAAVVVQRSRLMRTRPRFDIPWSVEFNIDADDDLVDVEQLRSWLEIAGWRIGLGDWRPEKSGEHGRFELESLEASE